MKNKKDTVILFCCHFLNRHIIKEFNRLKDSCSDKFDVILSYDNTRKDIKMFDKNKSHIFNIKDIKNLGYPFKEEESIWYHIDYPILHFFLKNPNYKYYWRVEYDVKFNGNWNIFFENFLENNSDLIGLYVKNYKDDPNDSFSEDFWPNWNKTNLKINNDKKMAIFFAIQRFSNRALDLLNKKYKSGIYGFCELIVPTLVNLAGFKIQDIGKKWYDIDTMRFNDKPLSKKNKLIHPVKNYSLVKKCQLLILRLYNFILRKIKNLLKFFYRLL